MEKLSNLTCFTFMSNDDSRPDRASRRHADAPDRRAAPHKLRYRTPRAP